jgi:hypothetical protein
VRTVAPMAVRGGLGGGPGGPPPPPPRAPRSPPVGALERRRWAGRRPWASRLWQARRPAAPVRAAA